MSTKFACDDKETLIAFVYDEVDADRRREVVAHMRACAACADEIEALRGVRRDLSAWQPPETALNFEIVQRPATVLRPSRWWTPSASRWAQAAAAVLLFATGVGLANLQVRYTDQGLTISTGWHAASAPASAPASAVAQPPAQDWRPALSALETDLRRELQALRNQPAAAPLRAAAASNDVDANALLRRVQALVNDSEKRQREELAIRLTQFNRDMDIQRRADLMRINSDFRQLQGRTGFVEGNQREMVNLLKRVSATQVP